MLQLHSIQHQILYYIRLPFIPVISPGIYTRCRIYFYFQPCRIITALLPRSVALPTRSPIPPYSTIAVRLMPVLTTKKSIQC